MKRGRANAPEPMSTVRWSFALERLEERMLCAADVDVALIDRTLPDPAALVRALQPGGKVFLYDGRTDSAEQILSRVSRWAERSGNRLRSVSLMSHGAAGRFALGSDWITRANLEETADEWQRLGNVLSKGASINLFGCNLIDRTGDGKRLINRLSKTVGATVFASNDVTGRGGDWVLEASSAAGARTGMAATPRTFSATRLARWGGSLAVPLGDEFLVNTTTTNTQRTHETVHAIATDSSGNYVVVWSGEGPGDTSGIFAQRYNALGVPQGSEFRVNTTTSGTQTSPAVAMDADGDFIVVWSGEGPGDASGIFAQRYDASGAPVGGEFRVNSITANPQQHPSVAMADAGHFVITWTGAANADGTGGEIYARRYSAAGAALGGDFVVNFVTMSNEQAYPRIAMDAAGNFVIAWASVIDPSFGWGIAAQRFASNGAALGSEFVVNQSFASDQVFPSIAMSAGGAFVIAWQSLAQDGSGYGIYARRYDAGGSAQGNEFRVNGATSDDQRYPSVAMDDGGNFTVTWQSANQDGGGGQGVYARDYTSAGTALGGEYLVNGTTTGNQEYPSIAMDSNGDFMIVWSGEGTGDADGVFARRYRSVFAGFTISQTSGHTTTEAGGTATYTIRLNHQPTSNVTLTFTSSDTTEGTVTSALTFTPADWNVAQTVTITGVNDFVDDGTQGYEITASASSADAAYDGLAATDVQVENTDDDTAGITVSPTSGLITTEAGGAATFTIVLTSQPTADVTIDLVSSNTGEGALSAGSLVFTAANWNVAQTVTVTGANDFRDDGNVSYTVQTSTAGSSDPSYNGMAVADVSLTNTDDDTAGITVSPTSGLTTTEAGGTATFTVVLDSQPSANVVINLSSSNTAEGTLSVSSLTFTPANWNVAQTVTVQGVNDVVDDGDVAYTITTAAATSGDAQYNGLNPPDVSLTNLDNDTAGFEITWLTDAVTTEAGGFAEFQIVLTSRPTSAVVISINTQDNTEGSATPNVYSLTTSNWNDVRVIRVSGIDDALLDGNIEYDLVISASSSDPIYDGLQQTLTLTNLDNDTPGITVSQGSLTVGETGTTATFTVVLDAAPSADVVITLITDNSEGTLSTASLLFTPANWSTPQTITVTGVNDFVDDGDVQFDVVLSPAQSADANYDGLDPADVAVTNQDDDTAGITIDPVGGLVTTEAGGAASYTIVLNSQPTADVVIAILTGDASEGQVSVSSLTFTPANWNVPQLVTITGVNDAVNDGDVAFVVRNEPAQSTDPNYGGLDAADVSVTNADDDPGRVLITPTSGLETTEAGGTTSFSVRLDSAPTDDVLVQLLSSDEGEGTLSATTLLFTPADWNVAQTVTIAGVDDGTVDGDAAYSIGFTTSSADPDFDGLVVADLSVVNRDTTAAAPSITASAGTRQVTENEGPRPIDPDLLVADANGVLAGATVRIIANYLRGEDLLAFASANGITGAWNATSGTLTLTGSATVAQYQEALRSVTYENTSDDPGPAWRTIRFTVTDGGASASASKSLAVQAVNDAPQGIEESYAVSADASLVVNANNGVLHNDEDVDNAADDLSALLVTPPTLGRLTLNPDGSFTYVPNAGAADGIDTFVYQTSDGTDAGEPVTVTITVNPATVAPLPPDDPEPEPQPEPPPIDEPEEPARPQKPERPDPKPPRETPGQAKPDAGAAPGSIAAPERTAQPPVRVQASGISLDRGPVVLTRAGYLEAVTIDYGQQTVIVEATPGNPEPAIIDFPTLPKWEVAQTLANSLDQLGDQLAAETQTTTTAAAVVGSAALVWVGYVVYSLRGGALLLTFLTSMPLWRTLDPLPVLEASEARAARKKNKKKKRSGDPDDPEERNLRTVLG